MTMVGEGYDHVSCVRARLGRLLNIGNERMGKGSKGERGMESIFKGVEEVI